MDDRRVRILKDAPELRGPVVYWMSRDQRARDNWALIFAQEKAMELKCPLVTVFTLEIGRASCRERVYHPV